MFDAAVDLSIPPADRLVTLPPFPLDGWPIPTLGPHVVRWMGNHLVQPNGPRAGQPFIPTRLQQRFLFWLYALDESTGRWLFNMAVRRWSKGSGKSPLAAAVALAEFCSDAVRLDGFDARAPGRTVSTGESMSLVQIVAAAEAQTKNTMRFVRAFSPKGGKFAAEHSIDVGKTQFYRLPESTLEVITSSFASAEGAQSTFAVGDEPEHWGPSNAGHELNATIVDNLTKTGGRMLHTANAWKPGIGSVAEDVWDDWVAQEEGRLRGEQRILYDARVAPPGTDMADRDSLRDALMHCYGAEAGGPLDCDWIDVDNIIERIWRASAKPDDSQRKYLNRPTAPSDAWVSSEEWQSLTDVSVRLADGDRVALFFDGSKSNDATALVACRIDDGHVVALGVWESDGSEDWTVDVTEVDAAVMAAFARFDVWAFFADVREWESFTKTEWPSRYRDTVKLWALPLGRPPEPIAWDMRGHAYEFARAAEMCHQEILDGSFTHGPADDTPAAVAAHSAMGRHVVNARRHWYRDALTVRKESPKSPKKIDAAVCVIGARMVRSLVMSDKRWRRRRTGGSGKVVVMR